MIHFLKEFSDSFLILPSCLHADQTVCVVRFMGHQRIYFFDISVKGVIVPAVFSRLLPHGTAEAASCVGRTFFGLDKHIIISVF